MISLLTQAQGFFGSFFLGMVFLFTWSIYNRCFYKFRGKWIRLPSELIFFILWAYLYFVFLASFTKGVYNIFYFLAFFGGAFIYYKFYHHHFLKILESYAQTINLKIAKPIKLKLKKLCGKIKPKKKGRRSHGKSREEERV